MPVQSPPGPLQELDQFLQKMNATPLGRRTFLASVPFLLAACATAQHRQREGDNTGQETELTVADEKKMALEVMPEMQKDYPPLPNHELQLYLRGLGGRLVRANGLEGNPYNYNFTVVGVNQVNAFALPAGTVFVTAPLIAMAETEAELAGVVGHELGHIKARHTAERMERAKSDSSWLFGAGGGILGAAAGFGLGKLLCRSGDNACVAKAAVAGAAAGVGGGLLIQKYKFMANSREDEMEADRIGFKDSVKSNYDKNYVGAFYAKLLKMEQDQRQKNIPILSGLSDAMSTHPPSVERVKQMDQLVAETPTLGKRITSTKEFDKARKIAQEWVKQQQSKQG